MTGQPDIVRHHLELALQHLIYAQKAALGETTTALFISTEPTMANGKHGRFDAKSAAEVAEGVDHEDVRRFIGGLGPASWSDPDGAA